MLIEPRKHPYMRAVLHNACQVRLPQSRCQAPLTAAHPLEMQVYGGSGAHLIIYHGTQNQDFVEEIIR